MDEKLYEALKNIHNLLSQNKLIKKVYYTSRNNIEGNKKLNTFNVGEVDIERVISSLLINIEFIFSLRNKEINNFINNYDNELIHNLETARYELKYVKKYSIGEKDILILIQINAMLVLFCCISEQDADIESLIDEKYELKNSSSVNTYYRGHSNYDYNLLPSIYRNIPKSDYYNISKIENMYNDSHLADKYLSIYNQKGITYDFCAYMQHSREYSPLLDFSSDYLVALSFATLNNGININTYLNSSAALFEMHIINSNKIITDIHEANNIIKKLDVYIYNSKLDFTSKINTEYLFYITYDFFKPEIFFIDTIATNDRMRYQKGCFLFISKGIIINGVLMMPWDFGFIRKYKINHDQKIKIYEYIKTKKHEYDFEHLMNPYLYFSEAPLKK